MIYHFCGPDPTLTAESATMNVAIMLLSGPKLSPHRDVQKYFRDTTKEETISKATLEQFIHQHIPDDQEKVAYKIIANILVHKVIHFIHCLLNCANCRASNYLLLILPWTSMVW